MTTPTWEPVGQEVLRAQVDAARASIAALRDDTRTLGQMPFKVRDMHVMRLHRMLDTLTQQHAELLAARALLVEWYEAQDAWFELMQRDNIDEQDMAEHGRRQLEGAARMRAATGAMRTYVQRLNLVTETSKKDPQ